MVKALASNASVALITAAGTAAGVVLAALIALVTAILAHRWQREQAEREHRIAVEGELRTARRRNYLAYVMSAQKVWDGAYSLWVQNHAEPLNTGEFSDDPPHPFNEALIDNETARVGALLLAGEEVSGALEAYRQALRLFWIHVGSGNQREDSKFGKGQELRTAT